MQNAKDRWFFKICFLLVAFASTSQQLCPSPDVPFQGSYFPKKQKFQSDDKITYSCVEGYSLMGNEINNCKSNGDWSNPVPFCDVKANLGSSFYYLDGRGGFVTKASNITDGILSSCSALHTGDAVGTFVAKEGLVYAIRLYLEKGRADLEIWTGTVVCARYRHFIDKSKWVLILCNKNNEVSDRIRIEDISDREKITFLCEFEFYMKDENGCDSPPDRKVSNGYFQVSRTKAELMCDDGYSTEDTGLVCQRNQWTGSNIRCNVDVCEDPPVPIGGLVTYLSSSNANVLRRPVISRNSGFRGLAAQVPDPDLVTIISPSGTHQVGTRAVFGCESRFYKIIGSRTRTCQKMGRWSGRPPICMPVCGQSDSPRSPFIVNGNATDIGQWPWQAGIARYLQQNKQWLLLCGASLLNEFWVITAAHCVTQQGTTSIIEPDKFRVYLGKYHRIDTRDDEYVQIRKAQEIYVHPDYVPSQFDSDIALIRLDQPAQLNSRVQPICLPTEKTSRENLVEGKKGVVTGWGTNEKNRYAETLQQAALAVVSQGTCERGYQVSGIRLSVTDNMYCAGYAEGRTSTCSGDSGGPMVFTDDSSKDKKWVLEGIVSWGSARGCGNANQYAGFTAVGRFLNWILDYL